MTYLLVTYRVAGFEPPTSGWFCPPRDTFSFLPYPTFTYYQWYYNFFRVRCMASMYYHSFTLDFMILGAFYFGLFALRLRAFPLAGGFCYID
jgi:hypothetical protein